jgi:hypothetical protein
MQTIVVWERPWLQPTGHACAAPWRGAIGSPGVDDRQVAESLADALEDILRAEECRTDTAL